MQNEFIIFPMFVMFLITLYTLQRMFRTRVRLARMGQINPKYYSIYREDGEGMTEPEESRVLGRHFANLYEAPVLFYVVCLAALTTQNASSFFQLLAWLYVLARIIHSYIHLGRNQLMHRIYAYMSSWAALIVMWVTLIINVAY